MKPVYVVGSANVDHAYTVTSFPKAGETLKATAYTESLGGKGANQATAAALAGGTVWFVGGVGDDAAGASVVDALGARGIDTSHLLRHDSAPTGNAAVVIDETGENLILVAGGANLLLSGADVRAALGGAEPGSLIVAQGEIPVEAIAAAAETAVTHDLSFVLNLAPFVPVEERILRTASLLVVNANEATDVATHLRLGPVSDAVDAAARLRDHLRIDVIATLGRDGCVVMPVRGGSTSIPSPVVDRVVDTTGAGDAFVGILAARIARGDALIDAARVATRGASFAVQRRGTTESYPDAAQLESRSAGL